MNDIMQAQSIIIALTDAQARLETLTTAWDQEQLDTIPIHCGDGHGALSAISNAISYVEEQIQNVIGEREAKEGDQ